MSIDLSVIIVFTLYRIIC